MDENTQHSQVTILRRRAAQINKGGTYYHYGDEYRNALELAASLIETHMTSGIDLEKWPEAKKFVVDMLGETPDLDRENAS